MDSIVYPPSYIAIIYTRTRGRCTHAHNIQTVSFYGAGACVVRVRARKVLHLYTSTSVTMDAA